MMIKKTLSTLLTLAVWLGVQAQAKKDITIADICKDYTFWAQSPDNLTPTADGLHYTLIVNDKRIEKYEYTTGRCVDTLVNLDLVRDCPAIDGIDGYEVSADEQRVLLRTATRRVYRHSFEAEYFVYETRYNTLEPLSSNKPQRMAAFSPNGQMVAFVYDNDLYIKKLAYRSESAVTTDGKPNKVINGLPDWVYEEEFGFKKAFEWSDDSRELAFIRFDESEVHEYEFPVYKASHPQRTECELYPGTYRYKYPKAGEANSKVSVHVYNVRERTIKTMDIGTETDIYVPRIFWTRTPERLGIVRLNRRQNQMEMLIANTASTVCNAIYTDRNKCFVDESALSGFIFLPDGKHFVCTSEADGYNHIYLYTMNGVLVRNLSPGNFDVTKLLGFNSRTSTVFYQAAKTSPAEREIYAATLDGKRTTCLTTGRGTHNAQFGREGLYFVDTYSSTTTPPVTTICNDKGKILRTIEDNAELRNRLKDFNISPKEFFSFETPDGISLNGYMVRPLNFDASRKYPVLMVQYSGPNSQEVLDKWDIDWEQTLAAEGYIVACIDPRGTGARGEEFRKCTYQKLGRYESDDQIAAARHLGSLPYVDASRIGIWGWSYGGFMSTLCMCRSDVFRMGIAVAPVVNWRFYDSIYTERYMRTPQENPSGYDDNSPIEHAQNLHGRLLLVHGTADDNVHYQNQMELVDRLVQSGKQFDMFTYPNRNHSIYGGNVRYHLYTMMLEYVKEKL